MSFGTTPLSTTSLGTNQFPVSAVYVPNTSGGNLTALQGGPASSADSQGNVSAPVAIYVADGSDITQGTSTDAAGANTVIGQLKQIRVNTASVTIGGGTLTANIGTTNGLALDTSVNGLLVSQGSTTSGEKGPLIQAAVTSSAPTYTTAQTSPLSLTIAGALRVDASATTQPISGTVTANAGSGTFTIQSNASVNLNQVAGSAVATAATGIIKVGLTDGSGNAITSTSNAIDVNIKSGGGSGFSVTDEAAWTAGTSAFAPTGGVFNDSAAALTAGQQGTLRATNNRALHVNLRDASANQLLGSKTSANSIPVVIASDQAAVAVNASQSGSWTVSANAGTNLNTSALALDTSVNGLLASQGSTTSGQKGPLIQGAVTTNAPSYTTAQTSPLSLDTSGLLRVSLKDTPANTNNLNVALAASSATVTVSGTVTANQGGSNWSVNVAQVAGGATSNAGQTGAMQVGGAVATNNNVSSATNPLLIAGSDYGGTPKVQTWKVDSSGNGQIAVTNTPSVAQSGTWTVQPGNTPNTSAWLVQDVVASSGGSIPYHNISAATTNFNNIKGSACQLYGYALSNTSGSAIYVKFYDKATAPGTGDNPKRTIQVPANGTVIQTIPKGLKFTSGFGWGATGAVGDNDNTSIAANCVIDFDLNS